MKKNYKSSYQATKEMKEHYQELFESSLGELRFEKLQVASLENIIDEIYVISDDELVKAVIENHRNRRALDKIIHAKRVFQNPDKFTNEKSNS